MLISTNSRTKLAALNLFRSLEDYAETRSLIRERRVKESAFFRRSREKRWSSIGVENGKEQGTGGRGSER